MGKERYRGTGSDGKVMLEKRLKQRVKEKATVARLLTGGPQGRYDRLIQVSPSPSSPTSNF